MSKIRTTALVVLSLLLVAPARATWSIVVVNRATGEVAVATSTCLSNLDISRFVPVIRVGEGAGASQSFVIASGVNKVRIFDNLAREATPQQIIDYIESVDNGFPLRQFGVVSFSGPPASHTGTSNGFAALGAVGEFGEWSYAIQGNVLTGGEVVFEAERAFLNTPGDLGERMMAAMESARDFGGDGRCSCTASAPASCGAPPVSGFTHASFNVYMGIARPGDTDGACSGALGCVNGDYYFDFNYSGSISTPEPIGELRAAYDAWRAALVGRPDHVLTEVDASMPILPADGVTTSTVTVRLVDVDGTPLTSGGQAVTVTSAGNAIATVAGLSDLGNGVHTFDLVSTGALGEAEVTIVVDDGVRPVQLHPPLHVAAVAPSELHLGVATYSASEGTRVPMVVDRGAPDAGAAYRVLGSLSGTSPGTMVGGTAVALNRDRFFRFTLGWPGGPPFRDSAGTLDALGRAAPALELPPGSLLPFVGTTVSFVALVGGDTTPNASLVVGP
ncbi:MAG: DUF1028 domain-containing protein [Planctomycetota bacterium]